MPTKVLVYGWYRQGNIGDDLFIAAYRHLFPQLDFVFSEIIEQNHLKDVEAVFFGGGSFLLDRPNITNEALLSLKDKKIFYIGVGVEGAVHPIHYDLMKQALLIAIRSPDQLERVRHINQNTMVIPDLVYSLQSQVKKSSKIERSVLVIPNIVVVPHTDDLHWKHAAWSYFKSEFTQFLDWLIDNSYSPQLFGMCHAARQEDDWVSAELISQMSHRHKRLFLVERPNGLAEITALMSSYDTIITQRFHGIVLAEMLRTPYVAIHHHDKLKFAQPASGKFLSYYNVSKHNFIDAFSSARKMNYDHVLPIEQDIFETLVKKVYNLL
jgi:polysaccharide pyruvyl transferase WcaK-like protein